MSPPVTAARGRLASIDGLRTIAIVPVIAAHAHVPGFHGGGVGVDVFFGISGFLITSLLLREYRANGRLDLRRFWLRRGLRLLPALLALVLVVDALALLSSSDYLGRSLTATPGVLLYYSNWLIVVQNGPALGWFGPLWSLSVEEQFYLVWPLLLMLALRSTRPLRAVALVAGAGVLAAAAGRAATFDGTNLYRTFGTDFRVDMLLVGVALAVVLQAGGTEVVRRCSRWLVGPALAYLVLVWLVVPDFNAGAARAQRLYYVLGLPLAGLATAVIIGHLVTHPGSIVTRVLSTRPLVWTGRISYGLYLWHYPVIMVIVSVLDPSPPLLLGLALAGTYAVAGLSWHFLETPLSRRFHDRLRARPSAEAPVSIGHPVNRPSGV